MKIEQFQAFLWLRWRTRVNQAKKAGSLNAILTAILAGCAAVTALGLFVIGIIAGIYLMPTLGHAIHLYIWSGATLIFLFAWSIGLLTEIQRQEGLAIDKFLHLPVSPFGAFLINYLSSFVSFTMIFFVPGMIGLIVGEIFSVGSAMLLALPLLAAFIFAVTAVTYQFQGWLAALMSNPRRRRTLLVLLPMTFVLLAQLPNLFFNGFRNWQKPEPDGNSQLVQAKNELDARLQAGEITQEEFAILYDKSVRDFAAKKIDEKMITQAYIERLTRIIATFFPPGWLALGTADLAQNEFLPAIFGGLGLTLIGSCSLWRGYRTTLRLYTQGGSGESRRKPEFQPAKGGKPRLLMVEWILPRVSEQTAAVATAALRSLLRAPEAKMLLIAPVIFIVIFGSMYLSMKQEAAGDHAKIAKILTPLIVLFGTALTLVTSMQLSANMFGFDRDGFRSYVMSPTPRRSILLGKNLAMAPLPLAIGLILLVLITIFAGMSFDHFLAAILQIVSMYLLFCLVSNTCSIAVPYAIPSGSLKASRPGITVILSLFAAMFAFPFVVFLPVVIPNLIEIFLAEGFDIRRLPFSLLLSLVLLPVVCWVYLRFLKVQGRYLQDREQRILELVTTKGE